MPVLISVSFSIHTVVSDAAVPGGGAVEKGPPVDGGSGEVVVDQITISAGVLWFVVHQSLAKYT